MEKGRRINTEKSTRKEKRGKNKKAKKVINIVIGIVAFIIICLIANNYIVFDKNKTINLVINNKNVTSNLKNQVLIENNTIYLSQSDIENFFDKHIYLEKENYFIYKAYDGEEALKQINDNVINLIIMDIMMPKKDGIETLEEIRKNKDIPVILLSAKSEDIDKINGLNIGADDYITKPFNPEELIARVNAIIRRCSKSNVLSEKAGLIKAGNLTIDDELKKVVVDGKEVKLTPTEYNILKFLTQNKGKVYSIDEIYTNIWEEESFAAENIIAVHIRHIREKIEVNPKEPKYLKVIWGVGYKVENL